MEIIVAWIKYWQCLKMTSFKVVMDVKIMKKFIFQIYKEQHINNLREIMPFLTLKSKNMEHDW